MAVFRQFKNSFPVLSYLFDYEDITIDRKEDFDAYALVKCQNHIKEFKTNFIEFNEAEFLIQRVEIDTITDKIISTRIIDS